jgi:hypothetical protein
MTPTNLGAYQPSPDQQGGKNEISLSCSELYSLFLKTIKEEHNKGESYLNLSKAAGLPNSTLSCMMHGVIKPKPDNLIKIQKFISETLNKTILINDMPILTKKKEIKKTKNEKYPLAPELYDRIKLAVNKLLKTKSTFSCLDKSIAITEISQLLDLPMYFLQDLCYSYQKTNGSIIRSDGSIVYLTSQREGMLKDFADNPLGSITILLQEKEQKNINTRDNIVAPPPKKRKPESHKSNNLHPDFRYPSNVSSNNVNDYLPSQQPSIGNPSPSNHNFSLENALEDALTLSQEEDGEAFLARILDEETDDGKTSQEKKNDGSINNLPSTNDNSFIDPYFPSVLGKLDAEEENNFFYYRNNS